jgi:phage/plasmid-associated DNA primase
LVKRLTGGDTKKGRFMAQDFFEFEQTFSLFMLVNHHPVITGVDHAIWRRVRLVPWTEQIPEAERLPQDQIVERLFNEGAAVLAWIVAGLLDWQKERRWLAPEVKAVTSAYRAEQDRLGAFLDEVCEEAPHYTVPVGELYGCYTTWCDQAGEDPLGKTKFGKRLRQQGKSTKSSGHDNVATWYGIRVKRGLRVLASPPTSPPLENELNSNEQENKLATTRNGENGFEMVDTETLLANEAKLRSYLDDDTVPFEERNKRTGEYKALVAEISRREKP